MISYRDAQPRNRCDCEENQRIRRKRRRPQIDCLGHDGCDDSYLALADRNDCPRTNDRNLKRIRNRRQNHCLATGVSPIFLWIALIFTCYEQQQSSRDKFLAYAVKLSGRTRRVGSNLDKSRDLQAELDVDSPPTIDYLDLPSMLWMRKDSRDRFLDGNSVQVSPFDDNLLYATTEGGDLRILAASSGSPIARVSPQPRTLVEDGTKSTWSIHSKSGLAFGTFLDAKDVSSASGTNTNDDGQSYNDYLAFLLNNGIQQSKETNSQEKLNFAVYSIVDEAPDTSRFLPKTRVVCVSIPDHKLLWTSSGLPGTPNGSPVIYYAKDAGSLTAQSSSKTEMYVVLTHNSFLIRPDNTTRTTGHLTVLDPVSGTVRWTQSEWIRDEIPKGYGPPQVSHNPSRGGLFVGGSQKNRNDVVVWTSSDEQGRGPNGNIYSFQMKTQAELELERKSKASMNLTNSLYHKDEIEAFSIRILKRVRWNSIARPTMNKDGTQLFIGVTGNAVRGWNGVAKFNETADWSTRLVSFNSGTNGSSPQPYSDDVVISTAPVLSADEKRLFVVTAKNEIVSLEASTGSRMWSATTRGASPLLGEPKASPDNKRLYMVMSRDGRVNGVDQSDGKILWSFGCDKEQLPVGVECKSPPVSADFDLSKDGKVLYFAAADGRIVALTLSRRPGAVETVELDQKDEKDPFPPISTGTSSTKIEFDDDDDRYKGPFVFDDNKSNGTFDSIISSTEEQKMSAGKIVGLLIAIVLSLVVALVSVIYVMKSKGVDPKSLVNFNWSDYRLPRQGPSANIRDKPHSFVARVSRGMFRVDDDGSRDMIIAHLSEDEKSIEEEFNTLWVDPTHSNPKASTNEEDSTADRLNAILGSTDEVAPISENFGFGQSVVL